MLFGLLLTALTVFDPRPTPKLPTGWCQEARVTGYVRTEFSPWTYDGTPINTEEDIAAASWNFPMGWHVWVEDIGTFRIADRGMLGSTGWVDIAVWTRARAYELTGDRWVCVYPPTSQDRLP